MGFGLGFCCCNQTPEELYQCSSETLEIPFRIYVDYELTYTGDAGGCFHDFFDAAFLDGTIELTKHPSLFNTWEGYSDCWNPTGDTNWAARWKATANCPIFTPTTMRFRLQIVSKLGTCASDDPPGTTMTNITLPIDNTVSMIGETRPLLISLSGSSNFSGCLFDYTQDWTE